MQLDTEENDTESDRERNEDLFPDGWPPGLEAEPRNPEQRHTGSHRSDHQEDKDPEAERAAGDEVIFGILNLL